MEQIGYQIAHAIVGRIRIRISWLEADPEAASKLQRLIESLNFVTSVRINPLAESIVISYRPRSLSIEEAEERFVGAIQQIKPTPLIVPPPPPEPVTPEPPAPQSRVPQPINLEDPTSPIEVPAPQAAASSSPPTASSVVPEIPSPWDEAESDEDSTTIAGDSVSIEPEPEISEAVEVHAPIIDSSSTSEELIDLGPHATSALARRLGITSQAITRRRSKSDFATWSQAQDPDGIAWHYDSESRLFHAIAQRCLP